MKKYYTSIIELKINALECVGRLCIGRLCILYLSMVIQLYTGGESFGEADRGI